MTLQDWIILVGVVLALPLLGFATYNQWSSRPGAMRRMVGGCAGYAIIISGAMLAAYLVG